MRGGGGGQDLVAEKVLAEASADTAVSLGQLPRSSRGHIARLVRGELTVEMLTADRGPPLFSRTFRELLLVFCEPLTGQPLKLLPPYGSLIGALMSSDGTLLVSWRGGAWELDEQLRNRLKFFAEHRGVLLGSYNGTVHRISAAVMRSFAANGIGIRLPCGGRRALVTLAELAAEPAFAAVRSLLATQTATSDPLKPHPLLVKFDKLLAAERNGSLPREVSEYRAPVGFQVLHWLRTLAAHVYLPKTLLTDSGLSVGVIDAAVAAAAEVWASQRLPFTPAGALAMPAAPVKPPRY